MFDMERFRPLQSPPLERVRRADRRELVEVAAEDDAHAAEGLVGRHARLSGVLVELLQQMGAYHRDLVDDEHIDAPPARRGGGCDGAIRRVRVEAGVRVDRHAADAERRHARRRHDRHLILAERAPQPFHDRAQHHGLADAGAAGRQAVTDMRPVARDGCPVNRDAPAISQRLRVRGRAIDRWKANGVSYTLVPVRTAEGTDFLFGSRSKINTSSGISRYTHTHTHRSRPLRQSRMPRRRRWA